MGCQNERSSSGLFSGDNLALIVILAIIVIFLTCFCGGEEEEHGCH